MTQEKELRQFRAEKTAWWETVSEADLPPERIRKYLGSRFPLDGFVQLSRLCEQEAVTLLVSQRQTQPRVQIQKPIETLPWECASLAFSDAFQWKRHNPSRALRVPTLLSGFFLLRHASSSS